MKAVVTGGGGFLGRRMVEMLREQGAEVSSLSRSRYGALEELGARCVQVDLADRHTTLAAFAELGRPDVVFHVAAKAGVWGPRAEYVRANVDATRHVIEACRAQGVAKLVYTSSASVCFDGRDHVRASNDLPYARRHLAHYPATKAEAERAVLAANDDELATVALRPHLIFGPRDPHLIPRLLESAAAGRLAIVGQGRNEVSVTYVDNAAHAHLCAARALEPGAACAGKAYFLGNEQAVPLWGWINALLAQLHLPLVTQRIPLPLAYSVGAATELLWRVFRRRGEPRMTRFVALQLARSHSYDLEPARRDLGYEEAVDLKEATARLVASVRAGLAGAPA